MAWLRAEIGADARSAAAKLRLSRHSDRHRLALTEKLSRAKAELAILDDRERTAAIAHPVECPQGEAAARDYLDAQRELCALDHVVRLLACGYRHREGCPESEEELWNFYCLCTEP